MPVRSIKRLDRVRTEVGRVDLRQPAAAAADGGADGVDDVGLGHVGDPYRRQPHGREPVPAQRATITDEPWPNRPWLAVMPTVAPST